MSTVSRLRHPKRPTPVSGRPRLRGAYPKSAPFDLTAAQRAAHEANEASPLIRTRGAFGGCTVAERARRQGDRKKEMVA